VEKLAELYRPLHDAAEADLALTSSGRKVLKATQGFAAELGQLYESIAAGKTPYEAGHRLAQRRRGEFAELYESSLREAYGRNVRLQPSVEAVAQTLRPDTDLKTRWVAESLLGSMLLTPKVVPDERGTARQGLGDPMSPQPVRLCQGPPYTVEDAHTAYAVTASALAGGLPVAGRVWADGDAWTTPFVPVSVATASSWVAADFKVPAGIRDYSMTVDYHYSFNGRALTVLGVATVSLNVAISIDKGDGRPQERTAHAIHLLTVPVAGGDGFSRAGAETTTRTFRRAGSTTQPNEPSNGTVRIWVGVDTHSVAVGPFGDAWYDTNVTVDNICLNSIV